MEENKINYEKIGIYFAILIGFLTIIFYLSDMKERIAKLEVKVDYLENKKG
jgi:hypothetical protein